MMPQTRLLSKALFPIVDSRGMVKPVLHWIVDEVTNAGIEEICIIASPGEEERLRRYFGEQQGFRNISAKEGGEIPGNVTIVTQNLPRGLGDAVLQARSWSNEEPVLIVLGDHLFKSVDSQCCASQLLQHKARINAPVSGVIQKPTNQLKRFGTIAGRPIQDAPGLYRIDQIVEKPEAEFARKKLRVAGLPEDQYLCWFGLHAMTPDIFSCLEQLVREGVAPHDELTLTEAQALLATQRPYYAIEINGTHFDVGSPRGYVEAVSAFSTIM